MTELQNGTPLANLPLPKQTIVIVYTGQGILGNGGLQYFFEADFPDKPSYSVFIDAYERIGAMDCAAALRQAVTLFGFANPERHVKRRNRCLDRWQNAKENPLEPFDKVLCGNKKAWDHLKDYAEKHRAVLSS